MVQDLEDGPGHFLNSKEGLTQGDPLAMITYVIGVLRLIRELWDTHPCITHPWYSDEAGEGVTFEIILAHFRYLQSRGPTLGYFLGPINSILVVAPRNMVRSEELFRVMEMTVVTGSRYLVMLFGNMEAEDAWLAKKVQGSVKSSKTLFGVARKHLQLA